MQCWLEVDYRHFGTGRDRRAVPKRLLPTSNLSRTNIPQEPRPQLHSGGEQISPNIDISCGMRIQYHEGRNVYKLIQLNRRERLGSFVRQPYSRFIRAICPFLCHCGSAVRIPAWCHSGLSVGIQTFCEFQDLQTQPSHDTSVSQLKTTHSVADA